MICVGKTELTEFFAKLTETPPTYDTFAPPFLATLCHFPLIKEAPTRPIPNSLENGLTSLNKEVRPFFLGDNSIWSFPSVSSLSDYSI